MEKSNLIRERICYVGALIVMGLWALLSELNLVPTNYLGHHPRLVYYLDLLSVVTSLGGTFVALRFFVFRRVAALLHVDSPVAAWQAYRCCCLARTGVLTLAVWFDVFYYYASDYTTTPGYCLLIGLIGWLFCWPSMEEFERLRARKNH